MDVLKLSMLSMLQLRTLKYKMKKISIVPASAKAVALIMNAWLFYKLEHSKMRHKYGILKFFVKTKISGNIKRQVHMCESNEKMTKMTINLSAESHFV